MNLLQYGMTSDASHTLVKEKICLKLCYKQKVERFAIINNERNFCMNLYSF